jgi:formylglycine-generating enzyme required for sulfatase activity
VPFKTLAWPPSPASASPLAWCLSQHTEDPTELVILPAATYSYRAAGEFLLDGQPVNPPLVSVGFGRPLAIMKNHVSRADYERCVAAKACEPIDTRPPANADTIPAVGVSWHDAVAYAAWHSRQTGHRYRLPTDTEWAYAAASLFHDNMVVEDGDAANRARRWIATYERTAASARVVDRRPQPFGAFGLNENGLADVAGNVWDWTATCFTRHVAGKRGPMSEMESCGVRVVEGAHRTYLSDFVRDPKGGGCSAGTPPNNLGIRLVRDDGDGIFARLAETLRRFTG